MAVSTERKLGAIEAKVDEIHKVLLGNGQPGLVQNFGDMKSRLDKYEGGMNFIKWYMGVFGVATISAIALLVKLYL